MLRAEYYEQAIPLLEAGHAEHQLLAEAWTKHYIETGCDYSDQHGYEQLLIEPTMQQQYLQPALQCIDLAAAESGQPDPLLQALTVSQTDALQAGLEAVNQTLSERHWNKDAVNLNVLILSASTEHARQQGRWDEARSFTLQTAKTYQLATDMARSYPPTYETLCLTHFELLADGIQRSGVGVENHTEQAIKACTDALITQPDYVYPKLLLSRIYLMKARWGIGQGQPVTEALIQAKSWNQQAGLADVFNLSWNQALILATEAQLLMLSAQSATASLGQVLELFAQLLKIETESRPYVVSDRLFVLAQQAHEMSRSNQPVEPVIDQALTLYEEVMLTPKLQVSEQWGLVNNMAQVLLVKLQQQDIEPLAAQLLALLNTADDQLQHDPHQLTHLANTHLLMAEQLHQQQKHNRDHLDQATKYLEQAHQINPHNHQITLSLGVLHTLLGHHGDQDFDTANAWFDQAFATNQNKPYSRNSWARSLLIQASSNPDSPALLDQEANTVDQLIGLDPNNLAFKNTQRRLAERLAQIEP